MQMLRRNVLSTRARKLWWLKCSDWSALTAFVDDKYYQSAFQVRIVTKGINGHDGATARSVGVAALAGIAAVLLMG